MTEANENHELVDLREYIGDLVREAVADATRPRSAADGERSATPFYLKVATVIGSAIADHEQRFHASSPDSTA